MTKDELKALIAAKIAGQGTAVDAGGGLAPILNGIIDLIPSEYSLPVASEKTLGGVKIGASLYIKADGALNAKGNILTVNSLATFEDYTAEQAAQSMGISVDDLSRLFYHGYCAISNGITLYPISIVDGGDTIYLFTGDAMNWGASLYIRATDDRYTLNEV